MKTTYQHALQRASQIGGGSFEGNGLQATSRLGFKRDPRESGYLRGLPATRGA